MTRFKNIILENWCGGGPGRSGLHGAKLQEQGQEHEALRLCHPHQDARTDDSHR